MEFGVYLPHAGPLCDAEAVRDVAQAAEELGFASVWVNDHIPHTLQWSEKFLCVGSLDAPNKPDHLEAVTSLSYVAASTKKVKLGFTVLVLPFRSPALLAKQCATLDVYSGGRLIFGVGAGGVEPEFRALGIPFKGRAGETVRSMRSIRKYWETGSLDAQVEGDDLTFELLPRPVQQPAPPIWFGGHTPWALRTTARHSDGWLPFALTLKEFQAKLQELDTLLSELERPRPTLATQHLIVIDEDATRAEERAATTLTARFGALDKGLEKSLVGSPNQILLKLRAYKGLGAEHVVLGFIATTVPEMLDDMRLFSTTILPTFQS